MNTRTFWIETVDEKTALDEVSETDYAGPVVQEATTQPVEKEGFSVDKTQDPFADKK